MATIDNRFPTEGTQIDMEARLAAIETALASLMTNTTGQSIASAITALAGSISPTADNVSFDNTGTGLTSSDVEGAIKELDTVNSFTLSNAVSQIYYSHIKKCGHLVTVYIEMFSINTTSDTVIGVIPPECRPSHRVVGIVEATDTNGTSVVGSVDIVITSNGNVNYHNLSSFTNGFCVANFVFFV